MKTKHNTSKIQWLYNHRNKPIWNKIKNHQQPKWNRQMNQKGRTTNPHFSVAKESVKQLAKCLTHLWRTLALLSPPHRSLQKLQRIRETWGKIKKGWNKFEKKWSTMMTWNEISNCLGLWVIKQGRRGERKLVTYHLVAFVLFNFVPPAILFLLFTKK